MILFSLSELSMEPTWITLQGTHPKLQDNLHYLTILFPSFFSFDSPTYFFKTIVFSLLKSRHCCSFLLHCYCSLDKTTCHKGSTRILFIHGSPNTQWTTLFACALVFNRPGHKSRMKKRKTAVHNIHWSGLLSLFMSWHPNFFFPPGQIFRVGREGSYEPIVFSLLACVVSVWRGEGSWNTSAQGKRKVSPSSLLLHKAFSMLSHSNVHLYLSFKHLPCTLSSVEAPNGCCNKNSSN